MRQLLLIFVAVFWFNANLLAQTIEQIPTLVPASFSPMIDEASKCVVYLMTAEDKDAGVASPFAEDPWFRPYFLYPKLGLSAQKLRRSLGSGIVLNENGIIVTSARLIQDKRAIKVVVPSSPEPFDAKVLGVDLGMDIAVLKIIGEALPKPSFADVGDLESGDLLFAIGNPFGLEPVVSMGIVSTLGKNNDSGDRLIRGDLFIHGGNIGGAIINAKGEIVGMPVRLRGMNVRENQGGFFAPIDRVQSVARRIELSGNVKEAWIGIAVADLTQEMKSYFGREDGVIITAIEAHSPAALAGLRKGDLIVLADNMIVSSVMDFERILATLVADRDVVFLYMRDKRLSELALRIGRLENNGIAAVGTKTVYHQGMLIEALNPVWQERLGLTGMTSGVVIVSVEDGTAAAESGFQGGDLIIQANERDIASLVGFTEASQASVLKNFLVLRNGLVMKLDMKQPIVAAPLM
ncbi:serine endoprotease DegQ [Campylobacterota bacterium]|nr:serine endoprotease DegQ [Campylobacterota bacterium]